MAQVEIPNKLKQILKISLILISVSAIAIIILGTSLIGINKEIKQMDQFLKNAEEAQPNFEESLRLYTEKTESVIDYLLSLRPSTEKEYVTFISQVEDIGQELKLNMSLSSIPVSENDTSEDTQETIIYRIKFYSSIDLMNEFLSKLEGLDYFIKIDSISYRNLKLMDEEEKEKENVNIQIKLYTKQQQ